jgi:hypothetical protein
MPSHAPYGNTAASEIYHRLFADDPVAFAPRGQGEPAAWQALLYGAPGDPAVIRRLAADPAQDSRVRLLAMHWLRSHGEPVPPKALLGVVVEVPLETGLDVLAAYADGGVRYLNQGGGMTIFEGPVPALAAHVQALLRAAQTLVARIGPTDRPRLPPPAQGNVRVSCLVSDSLCVGEGPYGALASDALAGPLLQAATALLQAVVAAGTAAPKGQR